MLKFRFLEIEGRETGPLQLSRRRRSELRKYRARVVTWSILQVTTRAIIFYYFQESLDFRKFRRILNMKVWAPLLWERMNHEMGGATFIDILKESRMSVF